MKTLRILLFAVVIIGIVVFAITTYVKATLSPDYRGTVTLPGLSEETKVYFTEYGIPHIYANSEEDAYRALGYVHAQDRLWQMDLLRRVGGGRLSELFGESLVETDKYFRTIGTADYAKRSAAALRSRNNKLLRISEAYIEGINQFIKTGPRTIEHLLLGIEMEPYTIENIYEALSYMSFSFANAQKTDPFLTELKSKLDSSYWQDLPIFSRQGEFRMPVTNAGNSSALSLKTHQVLNELNIPLFIGSNSWVIGPKKTTTGNVILANDPHIGFAQPSVWYEAHLIYPGDEIYGYFIAGDPIPPIMHNQHIATGLTMFENDDIDFYLENVNPEDTTQYQYKGAWTNFEYITETINVNGSEPVRFTKRLTKHGPVLSDVMEEEDETVSMYWVYTQMENFSLESSYELNSAKNAAEAQSGASKIHGPGLNVMFGSNKREYARWSAGRLIYRENELESKTYRDGGSGLHDPDSLRPFEQNPMDINSDKAYTYSANNQPEAVDGILYSGYYLPDDRGERIVDLLEGQDRWGVDDIKKMMLDHESVMFNRVRNVLLNACEEYGSRHFYFQLDEWDGTFGRDSYQAPFFQLWVYEIFKMAMSDEMDSTLWEAFHGTHLFKRSIEPIILNSNSKWWDDISTEATESRTDIIRKAYDRTWERLSSAYGDDPEQWKWENHHQLTHRHAMSAGSELLASYLDVGPFSVPGTNEVINNLGFTYSDELVHQVSFGPSTRRIVDLSDAVNNSWSILPTGQSGNPFSPYYQDQAEMYVNGEYRKMMMNADEIQRSRLLITMSPN